MELSDEKYFNFLEINQIMTKEQAKDIVQRLKNNESFYYIKKNTNINKFKIEKYILPFVSDYKRSTSCRYKYTELST